MYGCAPLGQNRFAPFQEAFLVDEDVVLRKREQEVNVCLEKWATVGAGLLVRLLLGEILGAADGEGSDDADLLRCV